MINSLKKVVKNLPKLMSEKEKWTSMFIDYETPHVNRIWRQWKNLRIDLHKIFPCEKSLFHPHPWPCSVLLVGGHYEMYTGYSHGEMSRFLPPRPMGPVVLEEGSCYEMTNPREWHSVRPLKNAIFSILVQGEMYLNLKESFESYEDNNFRELYSDEFMEIWNLFENPSTQKFMNFSLKEVQQPTEVTLYASKPK